MLMPNIKILFADLEQHLKSTIHNHRVPSLRDGHHC